MLRKRVALFGGSFNPIHNGHIALAHAVLEQNLVDDVWLLVSPQNPLKEQLGLKPEYCRLNLARKALQNEKHILASDFEFDLPRPSYTWNTLQALSLAYPQTEFLLLIGADNWTCFDHWANYKLIIQNYRLLIYPRPGYDIKADSLPVGVSVINATMLPVSSTMIRDFVANKTVISPLVPAEIVDDVVNLYSK